MKKTFNEKAASFAVRFSKKYKLLSPLAYLLLTIVTGIYKVGMYLFLNGKRYLSISFVLLFFLMSSSFTYPEKTVEQDVYLSTSAIGTLDNSEEINDFFVATNESEVITVEDTENALSPEIDETDDDEDYDSVISTELLAKEYEIEDGTEDAFSIDDFLYAYEHSNIPAGEDTSAFDKNAWYLILVNKTNPVPEDYDPHLVTLKGKMKCDARVKDDLLKMISAASKSGVSLLVVSPYRDYALQEKLFNRKVNGYIEKGYSYVDAYKYASRKVIIPGASEHQLGMAFDILTNGHSKLDYEFGDTAAGKWLKKHCAEYGFILRYPKGKEDITGIVYEPWHFRYVGVEAATYITEQNITLEEFIEGLN